MNKTGVGPLQKPSGELNTVKDEMADILNHYFGNVFTNEYLTTIPEYQPVN